MRKGLLSVLLLALVMCSTGDVTKVYSEGDIEYTKAPEFELSDLDGGRVSLKGLQGKVVALFFWATWCPYCRNEVPKLVKLNREFKEKGLEVLAINYMEDPNKLKKFVQKQGITYKMLIDKTGDVFELYDIPGVPVVMFIDRKGVIQYSGFGLPENYNKILEGLLSG